MLKWILLVVGIVISTIFVIALIKFMLKAEKDSKNITTEDVVGKPKEYEPEDNNNAPVSVHSASAAIPVTDMSKKDEQDFVNDIMADFDGPSGFVDDIDDEFADFSDFAHKSKGIRRPQIDFDLDGDMADEYIPSSPDFNYLPRRRQSKKQPIDKALNNLPTELKVLMLSDIFDRKFFD